MTIWRTSSDSPFNWEHGYPIVRIDLSGVRGASEQKVRRGAEILRQKDREEERERNGGKQSVEVVGTNPCAGLKTATGQNPAALSVVEVTPLAQ